MSIIGLLLFTFGGQRHLGRAALGERLDPDDAFERFQLERCQLTVDDLRFEEFLML